MEKIALFFIPKAYANKSTRTAWAQSSAGNIWLLFTQVLSTPFAKRKSYAHFY